MVFVFTLELIFVLEHKIPCHKRIERNLLVLGGSKEFCSFFNKSNFGGILKIKSPHPWPQDPFPISLSQHSGLFHLASVSPVESCKILGSPSLGGLHFRTCKSCYLLLAFCHFPIVVIVFSVFIVIFSADFSDSSPCSPSISFSSLSPYHCASFLCFPLSSFSSLFLFFSHPLSLFFSLFFFFFLEPF